MILHALCINHQSSVPPTPITREPPALGFMKWESQMMETVLRIVLAIAALSGLFTMGAIAFELWRER